MQADGYSKSHRKTVKVIVNRIFTYGIDFRIISGIDRSPAFGISLGREEEKMPEILNLDQIRLLMTEGQRLNDPWYTVWFLALTTGCRNGELYALLWSDVDFVNREIAITKSFNARKKIIKSTKGGYWRTVPISDELYKFLKELKATAGDRAEVLKKPPRWSHGEQANYLREFCKSTNLPSVRFHTLRACFATQLIRTGVPPIQIMKICGWKDLKTMQRYIRLAGIEIKGATNSLRVLTDMNVMNEAATNCGVQEGIG
jgi:integrase